jgi:sec-independent protein translocase protein TatA
MVDHREQNVGPVSSGTLGTMQPEWIIVALVALVLIGGSRLPKMARNIGRAQGELKKGLAEGAKEAAEAEAAAAAEKKKFDDAVASEVAKKAADIQKDV